jgi:acyl-CoA thioester hydrolase
LPENDAMPVLFFAPFVSSTMRLESQWIDYNGHLNLAYYHVLFDRAVDEAFAMLGLGPTYAQAMRASSFTAECHVVYQRELTFEDQVRMTLQLIDHDEKRLHYLMEMRHARDGWVAATAEMLSLHVDLATRRVTPFPPEILANLAVMKAAHARMPRPAMQGRGIAMGRHKEQAAPGPHWRETTPLLN